jgi:hypothetical protein
METVPQWQVKGRLKIKKNNMKEKTIKDLSLVELKSFAYDLLAGIENYQMRLKAVNDEIIEKSKQPPVEENKEEKK